MYDVTQRRRLAGSLPEGRSPSAPRKARRRAWRSAPPATAPTAQAITRIDENALWIYVGSPGVAGELDRQMETDEALRAHYRAGLALNARNACATIGGTRQFDNNDTKVFGHANWREVYPHVVSAERRRQMPRTARRIAETRRNGASEKHYEARFMRNPLAAAAIVALAGDGAGPRSRRARDSPLRLREAQHGGVLLRGMRVLRAVKQEMSRLNSPPRSPSPCWPTVVRRLATSASSGRLEIRFVFRTVESHFFREL